jgi:hypothetical protein
VLVAPFAVVVSPGCAGSAVGVWKISAEVVPLAAPRVVAGAWWRACAQKRPGRWARRRARRFRRESAPVLCRGIRWRGTSARGRAGPPSLPGVTATVTPRALAETPNAEYELVTCGSRARQFGAHISELCVLGRSSTGCLVPGGRAAAGFERPRRLGPAVGLWGLDPRAGVIAEPGKGAW